jgi:hypothetical protein
MLHIGVGVFTPYLTLIYGFYPLSYIDIGLILPISISKGVDTLSYTDIGVDTLWYT